MKARHLIRLFSVLFLLCVPLGLRAQVTVSAQIGTTQMLIGEQTDIILKVTAPTAAQVTFPEFNETKMLMPGIEVLREDFLSRDQLNGGKQLATTKRYLITSFDSALYYIPPFPVLIDDDTVLSKPLALKVETMEIDTTQLEKFFGPKGNAPVPFAWEDWEAPLVYALVLVILVIFMLYVWHQLHYHKPLLGRLRLRPVPPPHKWAIGEIKKINRKSDIQADSKAYYTRLTDILRTYIQQRFGFNAQEMTSSEIIEQLHQSADEAMLNELRSLFEVADLAKFAKLQTQLDENDQNLMRAASFINATRPSDEELKQQKSKPTPPPEVQRTTRTRMVLKTVIVVTLLAALGLIYLIGRFISYYYF